MKLATIALLLALAACAPGEDAAIEDDAMADAAEKDAESGGSTSDTPPPIPASFPEPKVAGRRFAITGRPTIDAAVFGKVRAYHNEQDGAVLQRGTYAITPDNQLCFHFEETAGNPCFILEAVKGKKRTFMLKTPDGRDVGEMVDIGASDLDG